ncbi:translation initiation factor IF-3, mitochondrial-like [Danaus plexippus]|uniref:translation initiation factor IF-3, mitochondrial-like n=1 Tax=Danaus plexippus TaxID=13037 RepID=UPI002AB08B87|nr:translation initiation factor IF-3, mitochondrial-like [Danaus plexippus]
MNKLRNLLSARRVLECRSIATRITADGKDIPKKKVFENRITLIGSDNSITITDLKSAQSLSTRRELKLVKIQDEDSKTRRPVYKLMTNSEYHEEELSARIEKKAAKENKLIKGNKLITLSSRIAEHDVMTNLKKMMKLLEKNYEVRVVVSGDESQPDKAERIYSIIEKNLKSIGNIVQKRNKGNNLRFQVLPLRDNSNQSKKDSNSGESNDQKGPL